MLLLSFCARRDFVVLEQSVEVHATAIDDMQRFRINGTESSSDWIEQYGDVLSATGFVSGFGYSTYHRYDFRQFMFFVPEEIDGIMTYHVLFFFETPSTVLETLDASERDDNFGNMVVVDRNSDVITSRGASIGGNRLARVDFTIHDGWIRAERIVEYANAHYPQSRSISFIESDAFPRPEIMRQEWDEADSEELFWLDVSEGEIFELRGASNGGMSAATHARIPARLGYAVIYHYVKISNLNPGDARDFVGTFTVPVTLREGVLMRYRD